MLEVLGTGQPRTGTHSLKVALEILGYGKCFHMVSLLSECPEKISYFEDAHDGKNVKWDELFADYQSAVDFPASLYYKSILKTFPDVKIIHTTRDPEAWFTSATNTIFNIHKKPKPQKLNSEIPQEKLSVLKFSKRMLGEVYGDNLEDKKTVIEAFKKYNEDVLETVPKKQLLVFSFDQGWEPLCKFLAKPIPRVPFPNTNSTSEFLKFAGSL